MKIKLQILSLLLSVTVLAQTSTVTVNTSTHKTQPPVGILTLEGASNFVLTRGSGTPEGTITATMGSLYLDRAGKLWMKSSGTGNTGWVQMGTGTGSVTSVGLSMPQGGFTITNSPVTSTGTLTATQHVADSTHDGYLDKDDWIRFDAAVSGAGVSSWNGRTGTVVPTLNDYSESQISFTDITTNNVSSGQHGYTPKLPGDGTLFFNGAGDYVAIPGSGSGVSQLISGGGVSWTGTGFNYIISAAVYTINGTQYASPQTNVTLDAADPSQDRIDVFYVDTSGTAGVITGTPGTPPVAPSVDPASQLLLTFTVVEAASTEPPITNENIYLENTEYTMSTSAGSINLSSTNNPYAGTKDIEGTNVAASAFFTALKPSGTLTISDYTQLVFQVRSKAAWPKNKSISVFWMSGATVIGSSVAVKDGTFGFDSSNTSTYQQIVIPASSFGGGISTVDRLRMAVSGGGASIGWYIDNIILQAGGGGGGGGGTVTSFSSGNLSPLFTTVVTNPNTTPALTFTLSDAGANTYFGNATGGATSPSYTAAAALTKSDDTNVTLTLGGNASTALLRSTSLTLGWTGTLGLARGGFGKAMTDPNADRLVIWDDTDGDFQFVTVGTNLTYTHSTHTLSADGGTQTHAVTFVVDGGGTAITAATYAYIKIPYGGTLTGWTLIGTPSGSVTVDIYRATDTNGLPVTSIVGGGGTKPALSTAVENKSTSFTGWTSTTLNAFDNLAVAVSGVTSTTYCALTLYYQ